MYNERLIEMTLMIKIRKIWIYLGTFFLCLQFIASGVSDSDFSATLLSPRAYAQNRASWNRFNGKGEEFSVLMPGEPTLYVDSVTAKFRRTIEERIYSSYSAGKLYLVVSYNGAKHSFGDILEFFQINHHANDVNLTFERDLNFSGGTVKQFTWKLDGTPGTLQVVHGKQHSYVVAIVQAVDDPDVASYFLSSFSLNAEQGDVGKGSAKNPKTISSRIESESLPYVEPDKVFSGKDVTKRAVTVSRPQPSYTEEARRNNIAGTVVARVVLTSTGVVTSIHAVNSLPDGLTENAIEAARHIRFIPAIKDGKFVSIYMAIEYNFNVY